jgi:hypothetical protein
LPCGTRVVSAESLCAIESANNSTGKLSADRIGSRMKRSWSADLRKKMGRGFRGYPVGTVAFYGPDDRFASKVVAAVIEEEHQPARILKKWFAEELDARIDSSVGDAVMDFLKQFGARSFSVSRGIIGCPHEEEIDYPLGESCPMCPFWTDKDRWKNA